MDLRDLFPLIKPYAIKAPDVVIETELIAAASELASASLAFRRDAHLDAQVGWGQYDLNGIVSEDEVLLKVHRVCVLGMNLDPLNERPCPPAEPTQQCETSMIPAVGGCCNSGEPGFFIDHDLIMHVYPVPWADGEDGITIEYSFKPSLVSCSIDKRILDRHGRDICNSALSMILLMKGTDWYNPTLAGTFGTKAKNAVEAAKAFGANPHQGGGISMKPDMCEWMSS